MSRDLTIGVGIIVLVFVLVFIGCGVTMGWQITSMAFAAAFSIVALITLAVWFIVRAFDRRL